jgi:hypothetical protein
MASAPCVAVALALGPLGRARPRSRAPRSGAESPRPALFPQIKRARDLRAGGRAGPFDAFVVARIGLAAHRTHVVADSCDPEWNEAVVFDAASLEHGGHVITFEVYSQGFISDDLVGGQRRGVEVLAWRALLASPVPVAGLVGPPASRWMRQFA